MTNLDDRPKKSGLKNCGPLLVVTGETASGKSQLAMELALRFGGELICADSWTVYKDFDIGTAKPTFEDQKRVPHHLLDVAEPLIGFSAAEFQKQARVAIEDISRRGKLPILVGGTGLYIDCVIYDYSFLPQSDPALRHELNELSLSELVARADNLELDTTSIDLRNKRRVIRLIENNGVKPTRQPLREQTLLLGLQRDREKLASRIIRRIDQMVADGFADEVSHLSERYGWDCEPMQAPNYQVFKHYITSQISLEQAKELCIRNDLQLAKKQRTWFRRNDSIHWISQQAKADEITTTFLNKIR